MICDRETTAVGRVLAAFDRIADTNDELQAWAWLDRDAALAYAAEFDSLSQSGWTIGPLHGVLGGLKDIIDTAAMPTALGSQLLAGRQLDTDAFLAPRLRSAVAVVIGKTATTAFDYVGTRNANRGAIGRRHRGR